MVIFERVRYPTEFKLDFGIGEVRTFEHDVSSYFNIVTALTEKAFIRCNMIFGEV